MHSVNRKITFGKSGVKSPSEIWPFRSRFKLNKISQVQKVFKFHYYPISYVCVTQPFFVDAKLKVSGIICGTLVYKKGESCIIQK